MEVTWMNERENYLRAIGFKNPRWIPFNVVFSWGVWHRYREDLARLLSKCPNPQLRVTRAAAGKIRAAIK